MRKPRDFDSEMKALNERAKLLKDRKLYQLGELVIATGADSLSVEHLAGALLAVIETKDGATMEGWRKRGAAFFQRTARKSGSNAGHSVGCKPAGHDVAESAAREAGA
ncbi:conjugal transfer protein TraD [Sphingomonas gei]|uniref:Conjugal transfer protein TraD n=1 Tax=Sphingomonas gei TaxID=1395960 RepID=A0A4S1XA55_9SPHN|nr:conjugal transfer protein TraD [Sphingomonas gei]TGX53184.1 conjugal transfer protein TraD [Sphingomonas gei]